MRKKSRTTERQRRLQMQQGGRPGNASCQIFVVGRIVRDEGVSVRWAEVGKSSSRVRLPFDLPFIRPL